MHAVGTDHNGGFEGYLVYKAVTDLTLWAGFGYDTNGSPDLAAARAVRASSTLIMALAGIRKPKIVA